MKLKFNRSETRSGFIRKTTEHELFTKVELTDEERAAYGQCEDDIKDHIVAEYEYRGVELNMRVRDLIHTANKSDEGFRMAFGNVAARAAKEEEIKEGAKALSTYLKKMVAAGAGDGEEEIEL